MTNEDNTCASCGASIAPREKSCSHCGKTVEKATVIPHDTTTYATRESEDGMTQVEFGDGARGARPTSGVDGVRVSGSSRVRKGNADEIKCPKCMTVQPKKNKRCEKCGANLVKRRLHLFRRK